MAMARSNRTPKKLQIDVEARGIDRATKSIGQLSTGLESTQKILDKLGSSFQTALIPTAALSGAITGIAVAGLRGTTEMYMLNFQMSQFQRQIASALLPIVDAFTVGLSRAWRGLNALGRAGQIAVLVITAGLIGATIVLTGAVIGFGILTAVIGGAIGAAMAFAAALYVVDAAQNLITGGLENIVGIAVSVGSALAAMAGFAGLSAMAGITAAIGAAWGVVLAASKELRGALWEVFGALQEIGMAVWPIVKAFGVIGFILMDVGFIKPLIAFLNVLTIILHTVAKLIERLQKALPIIGQLAALAGGGEMRMVTSNQTGQESFTQTFNRIQEAILKVEDSPIEQNTSAIAGLTASIDRLIERIPTNGQELYNSLPTTQEMVEGASDFTNRAFGGIMSRVGSWIGGK